MEERLQKLISAAGICSRRAAETLISAGRVSVNGQAASVGDRADPETDEILLDGQPLAPREQKVYLLLNKPRGYVTTLSDEQGRPTVADLVRNVGVRVFPVGRLDFYSEGLVLMTNDGALTQRLLHPSREIEKTYWLSVFGDVDGVSQRLSAVTDLDGERICPAQVELLRRGQETAELLVTIHEGKNRQIRRMCEACGLGVKRLRRIQEHTLKLGDLPVGHWRLLSDREVAALKAE